MTIQEAEKQLIESFSLFDDWLEKYNYLIEMGKELPPMDEAYKKDKYLIRGCQAQVWLHPRMEDGKLFFEADSDALITKGIVALLIKVLSGHPPGDIVNADLSFIEHIGLREHLSQTRSNGLLSMIKQMKLYAIALSPDQQANKQ